MSVLARDLNAYNDALDRYRRQVGGYNRQASDYNASLVTNDQGSFYITDGSKTYAIDPNTGKGPETKLPKGLSMPSLGRTQLPDDPKYSLLRQNPMERKTERVTATFTNPTPQQAFSGGGGKAGYYYNNKPIDTRLYSLVEEIPEQQMPNPNYVGGGFASLGQPKYITGPKTAIFERDASVYPDAPGEQPQLNYRAPDPTFAQARKINSASLAETEGGLTGGLLEDVIRSGGLKAGSARRQGGGAA